MLVNYNTLISNALDASSRNLDPRRGLLKYRQTMTRSWIYCPFCNGIDELPAVAFASDPLHEATLWLENELEKHAHRQGKARIPDRRK